MADTIKVAVRVRPAREGQKKRSLQELEKQLGNSTLTAGMQRQSLAFQQKQHLTCVEGESNSQILIDSGVEERSFTFDYVASPLATQSDVWENVGLEVTKNVFDGFNGTIIAYGQTGSGKTHTVFGNRENKGIVPRALKAIWQYIYSEEHRTASSPSPSPPTPTSPFLPRESKIFSVTMSMCEIYNERVYDLLDATSVQDEDLKESKPDRNDGPARTPLQLRDDPTRGIYVENLTEETIQCPAEAESMLDKGLLNRHTGCTAMNRISSRSHAILTLRFTATTDHEGRRTCRTSQFTLVDLAGSERHKKTKSSEVQLREAGQINKSLSELGNVIHALTSNSNSGASSGDVDNRAYVQYRNSKLTLLLRDSLGGNTRTALVATVTDDSDCLAESLITLKFAQRAKFIRNAAHINERLVETGADLIEALQAEIRSLKERMRTLHCPPTPPVYRTLSMGGSGSSTSSTSSKSGSRQANGDLRPLSAAGFIAGTTMLHSSQKGENVEEEDSATPHQSGMGAAAAIEAEAAVDTEEQVEPGLESQNEGNAKMTDAAGLRVMCEALMEAVAEERERADQAEEALRATTSAAEAEREGARALESEYHKVMMAKGKAEGELHWLRDELDSLYVQNETSLAAKQSSEKALDAAKRETASHEQALNDERIRLKEKDDLIASLHEQQQALTDRESGAAGAIHALNAKLLEQEREWTEHKQRMEGQLAALQQSCESSEAQLLEERQFLDKKTREWDDEKEMFQEQQEAWATDKLRLVQRGKVLEEENSRLSDEVSHLEEALKAQNEQHLQQLFAIRDEAKCRVDEQRHHAAARDREREEEARRHSELEGRLMKADRARDDLNDEVRKLELAVKARDGELAKAQAVWGEKERSKNDEILTLRGDLKKERARSMEISIAAASAAASVAARADKEQVHPNAGGGHSDRGITPPSIAKALSLSKTPFNKSAHTYGHGSRTHGTTVRGTTPGDSDYLYYITQTGKKLVESQLDSNGSGSSSTRVGGGSSHAANPKPRALELHMPVLTPDNVTQQVRSVRTTSTGSGSGSSSRRGEERRYTLHAELMGEVAQLPADFAGDSPAQTDACTSQPETPIVPQEEAVPKKNVPVWH